eukprot:5560888-Amphidinium_carterae.1
MGYAIRRASSRLDCQRPPQDCACQVDQHCVWCIGISYQAEGRMRAIRVACGLGKKTFWQPSSWILDAAYATLSAEAGIMHDHGCRHIRFNASFESL